MKSMNTVKTVLFVVLFLLVTGQVVPAQAKSQNPFGSDINETINRVSKKLPMVLDGGNEKVIHVRRTFTKHKTKRMEKQDIANEKPEILSACCSDDVLRNCIDRGVSFHFDYYGKNGLHVASTVVDRRDCQPRSMSGRQAEIADRAGVYILFANGIVRDTSTNLEWIAGPDRNITWGEANAWVKRLKVGGGGWRMPTLKELESLYKKGTGPRNMTPFLKIKGWWVWSGETVGDREARSFSFGHGFKGWMFRGNSSSERVFAVRSSDKG